MKTTRRSAAVSRRSRVKSEDKLTAEEVTGLEEQAARFEASERAWRQMTAPLVEEDPWTRVEDHLLQERGDPERRWKFFSK